MHLPLAKAILSEMPEQADELDESGADQARLARGCPQGSKRCLTYHFTQRHLNTNGRRMFELRDGVSSPTNDESLGKHAAQMISSAV